MTVRPNRGLWWALGAAVALNLLSRRAGGPWLAVESGLVGAAALVSLVLRPRVGDLDVKLVSSWRGTCGDTLEQHLHVRNPSRRPVVGVRWSDDCPGLSPVTADIPPLHPGEEFRTSLTRQVLFRGTWPVTGQLVSTAPLGVLRSAVGVPLARAVFHPSLVEVASETRPGRPGQDEQPGGRAGHGIEVLGLRPWRSGDPARDVSARASARHGRPVVMEREREEAPGPLLVVLAVGGRRTANWETAVATAASHAVQALRDGRRVLLHTRSEAVEPRTANEVLDFFAGVDDAPELPVDECRPLLMQTHPGGTRIYLAGTRSIISIAEGDDGCCRTVVLRA